MLIKQNIKEFKPLIATAEVDFCADDYGLCDEVSANIQKCIDEGALNKVSVFPNFQKGDLQKTANNKNIRISLHLNLVEGKCMADAEEIDISDIVIPE